MDAQKVTPGEAHLTAQVERLTVSVGRVSQLLATLTANAENSRAIQIQEHDLLIGVLRLLRGDEKGDGGLTARIVVLENKINILLIEKDKSHARIWQIVAAVIAALVVRGVIARIFGAE